MVKNETESVDHNKILNIWIFQHFWTALILKVHSYMEQDLMTAKGVMVNTAFTGI